MKKQGISILLIILMLITPIALAFDHCVGMDMSVQQSESPSFSITQSVDNINHSGHQKILNGLNNNQTDSDCQTNSGCIVHACGGYGITSSVPALNAVAYSFHSTFEYVPPYSTLLVSDLKPPISIL